MIATLSHTIQIFEHQIIRVGEVINGIVFSKAAFQSLAIYHEKQRTKYFSLVYNGIKFSHYVGVIQIGGLTLEILPKADKSRQGDAYKWQSILIEMLRTCKLINTEVVGVGRLSLKSNSILDVYFDLFLSETHQLLIRGLPKSYIPKEGNQKVLKGRLDLPKQLRKNQFHPERFYIHYTSFEYDHLFNQVLFTALKTLEKVFLKSSLQLRLKQLLAVFPKVSTYQFKAKDFDRLLAIKKYQPYHSVLEIARLILMNFSPDIRSGRHHLLALLFDMNVLYEEYVFRQLKKLENADLVVKRQTAKPFWQRRSIRPDILLHFNNKNYVLDTKWKVLKSNSPSIEDLKQLYIYCQYFDAQNGVLLFPNVYDLDNTDALPFHSTTDNAVTRNGQIMFLEIVDKNGVLNKSMASELLNNLDIKS